MRSLRPATTTFALTGALAFAASPAHADEPRPVVHYAPIAAAAPIAPATPLALSAGGDDLIAFPYVNQTDKHYLRAALEILAVYGYGLVDYLLNTSARGGHLLPGDKAWDLHYDWPTFRAKLTGENYHLDTNRFNTNYISHPFAGTLYYTAARSSHLSVTESAGYAIVGGFLWEYFGEFREEVSINDILVTPFAGVAIGESMMQIGGVFKRGKKTFANDFFATFFAPVRSLNDWAEGSDPRRSTDLDELNLPREEWHRFDLFVGGGATWQRSDAPGHPIETYADTRFGVDMSVVNSPGFAGEAHRSAWFEDGNASRLHFDATLSRGNLADALFAAEMNPAGYYWRDATLDAAGRPHGDGGFVAARAAFEYAAHDYARDDRANVPVDTTAIVSPLGLTAEYHRDAGALRLRARFDLGGGIAGVESLALGEYRRAHHHDDTNLQSVLRDQGYYHAIAVSLTPQVSLTAGDLELGARVRLDTFRGIEGYDEEQPRISEEVLLVDRRMLLAASASYRIPHTRLVLTAAAQHLERSGDVGESRAARRETSIYGTILARF